MNVNSDKKPKVTSNSRFMEFESKRKERLDKLSQDRILEEKATCTFRPKTNDEHNQRSLHQFLREQQSYESRKQERLDAARMQQLI